MLEDSSKFDANTHLHDSDKEVECVEVKIPEYYEYFQDFLDDRQNLVHQNFPISSITKDNVFRSYIEARCLVQNYIS